LIARPGPRGARASGPRDGQVRGSLQNTYRVEGTLAPSFAPEPASRCAGWPPAGTHRLVFRDEPKSFRLGHALSVGGLAVIARALRRPSH